MIATLVVAASLALLASPPGEAPLPAFSSASKLAPPLPAWLAGNWYPDWARSEFRWWAEKGMAPDRRRDLQAQEARRWTGIRIEGGRILLGLAQGRVTLSLRRVPLEAAEDDVVALEIGADHGHLERWTATREPSGVRLDRPDDVLHLVREKPVPAAETGLDVMGAWQGRWGLDRATTLDLYTGDERANMETFLPRAVLRVKGHDVALTVEMFGQSKTEQLKLRVESATEASLSKGGSDEEMALKLRDGLLLLLDAEGKPTMALRKKR